MVKTPASQRLAATIALLAALFFIITVLRIFVADPLGWIGISGSLLLLLVSVYWLTLGRTHQRLLALLSGIGSLLLLGHLLSVAPLSNLWNTLSAIILLSMASLAAKQALTPTPVPASAPPSEKKSPPRFSKMTLLINPKSGGGKAEKFDLVNKARSMGVDVHVLSKEDDLLALAREAAESGAEVLAMGGGDGSLGLVATVAMEYNLPFICIPVGTRNHFAMDMNLDRNDPVAALAAFQGEERLIDVATIGDRVFLNNASFGVYAAAINEPGYRDAKATAFRTVIAEVLNGQRQPFDLQFESPKGARQQAFFVFVGNNPYEFIGLEDLGGRPQLDAGQLQITVVEAGDHEALGKLAQGMIIGNPDFIDGFQQWQTTEFTIDAASDTLAVGTDGEALDFPTPITMAIRPNALRVLVPPGTPLVRPNPATFTPENLQRLTELVR
jgi:diacylglycerol kinase family enzyme